MGVPPGELLLPGLILPIFECGKWFRFVEDDFFEEWGMYPPAEHVNDSAICSAEAHNGQESVEAGDVHVDFSQFHFEFFYSARQPNSTNLLIPEIYIFTTN